MSPAALTAVGAVAAAIGGLLTVWLNDRAAYRRLIVDGQNRYIDRLEAERVEIKESLAVAHRRIDGLVGIGHAKDDYIAQLRSHIAEQRPPPAPPFPAPLLPPRGVSE